MASYDSSTIPWTLDIGPDHEYDDFMPGADDHEAVGINSFLGSQPASRLLSLPPELRLRIYEFVALSTTILALDRNRSTVPALGQVCRQICCEYRAIFVSLAPLVAKCIKLRIKHFDRPMHESGPGRSKLLVHIRPLYKAQYLDVLPCLGVREIDRGYTFVFDLPVQLLDFTSSAHARLLGREIFHDHFFWNGLSGAAQLATWRFNLAFNAFADDVKLRRCWEHLSVQLDISKGKVAQGDKWERYMYGVEMDMIGKFRASIAPYVGKDQSEKLDLHRGRSVLVCSR